MTNPKKSLSAFEDLILQEIIWCQKDDYKTRGISDDYRNGYLKGLEQAKGIYEIIKKHPDGENWRRVG